MANLGNLNLALQTINLCPEVSGEVRRQRLNPAIDCLQRQQDFIDIVLLWQERPIMFDDADTLLVQPARLPPFFGASLGVRDNTDGINTLRDPRTQSFPLPQHGFMSDLITPSLAIAHQNASRDQSIGNLPAVGLYFGVLGNAPQRLFCVGIN